MFFYFTIEKAISVLTDYSIEEGFFGARRHRKGAGVWVPLENSSFSSLGADTFLQKAISSNFERAKAQRKSFDTVATAEEQREWCVIVLLYGPDLRSGRMPVRCQSICHLLISVSVGAY